MKPDYTFFGRKIWKVYLAIGQFVKN